MDRFKFRVWDRFKFRVWDKEDKEFLDKFSVDFSVNGILILWRLEGKKYIDLNDNNRYIPEQSTGLKDKNGNLIYEGDILKSNNTILKVFWWSERGSFAFKKEKYIFTTSQQSIALCGFEVIGNIHENPELLEDK